MSEFAFNNYCIVCDQLCQQSDVYCSDACKKIDETQAPSLDATQEHLPELVSPLLTPSVYQSSGDNNLYAYELTPRDVTMENDFYKQQQTQNACDPAEYLTTSPLMLSKRPSPMDIDYHSFDLNSTASSNLLSSTSKNYRKWLTACL